MNVSLRFLFKEGMMRQLFSVLIRQHLQHIVYYYILEMSYSQFYYTTCKITSCHLRGHRQAFEPGKHNSQSAVPFVIQHFQPLHRPALTFSRSTEVMIITVC